MVHRVFRSPPTREEVAERIDAFIALLREGVYWRALIQCPIEGLDTHVPAEELRDAIAARCPARARADLAGWIAALDRRSGLELARGADDSEVLVRASFGATLARFVLTDGRALWFERFE